MLLFYTVKGVKGCMHSKGYPKYITVLELLMPLPAVVVDGMCAIIEEGEAMNRNNSNNNSVGSSKKKGKKAKNSWDINDKDSTCGALSMHGLDSSHQAALNCISEDAAIFTYITCRVVAVSFVKLFRYVRTLLLVTFEGYTSTPLLSY